MHRFSYKIRKLSTDTATAVG